MKKFIVVSPSANATMFERYNDFEFVGVDEGIAVAHRAGLILKYAISDFETISLDYVLKFMDKENVLRYTPTPNQSRYEKVINFLLRKGAEEIVILTTMDGKFDHFYNLILVAKNEKARVYIQDEQNLTTYYGKGSHVLARQDYDKVSLVGCPEAVISMEHVVTPVRKVQLVFGCDRALSNKILERIAVLKVESGGVIAVLEK